MEEALMRALNLSSLRPWSLLLLRIGTGLLLVIWGLLRVTMPAAGPGLADRYYSGLFGGQTLQVAYGAVQVTVGVLVVLGLFRRIAYPALAVILVPAALMLWRYLLDPYGMYLLSREDSQILFFPSITVAAATLALLAFGADDKFALDRLFGGRRTDQGAS
jgi:putative oxidoreductase